MVRSRSNLGSFFFNKTRGGTFFFKSSVLLANNRKKLTLKTFYASSNKGIYSFILSTTSYYQSKTIAKKSFFYLYNDSTNFYDSLRYGNQSFLINNVKSFFFAKSNKLTYWLHTFNRFIAVVLTNVYLLFCVNSPLLNQTAYSFWVNT